MKESIIFEDKDIIAFNKPAGVNFDWILEERPSLIPVHRLDKETSGIILFAKNQEVANYLKNLFQTHQMEKTYKTLVVGNVKNNSGIINLPIGRSKKTPLKRVAVGEQRGKIREAITEYKVLKRFDGYTFLEAYPKTGRTHQIRSHFAAIGNPVVCDRLYGRKNFPPAGGCPGGLKRQFLHAAALEFNLPSGGKLRLEADLPEDLEYCLQIIEMRK